jgi:hypothetical protein
MTRNSTLAAALAILLSLFAANGCAKSTIESRKEELAGAYHRLPPEMQALVDQGRIRTGMTTEAVYMAWGSPEEVLESETEQGHLVTWIYHGHWVEETRFWTYREVARRDGIFLERHLESDYFPRAYIRAEIVFENGVVKQWRTLPRPS